MTRCFFAMPGTYYGNRVENSLFRRVQNCDKFPIRDVG